MTEDPQIARLQKRVSELEQVVATMSVSGGSEEDDPGRVKDARWSCEKCGMLLAFYDRADDVLRMRHKEYLAYARLGVDGWIQIVCKSCGHPNQQAYVSQEELAEAERVAAKAKRAIRGE